MPATSITIEGMSVASVFVKLAPDVGVEFLVALVDDHLDVPSGSTKARQHLGGNLAAVAGGLDVPLDLGENLVGDVLAAGHLLVPLGSGISAATAMATEMPARARARTGGVNYRRWRRGLLLTHTARITSSRTSKLPSSRFGMQSIASTATSSAWDCRASSPTFSDESHLNYL